MDPTKLKQDVRVFWKTDESKRLRMGKSLPNHHEDHITGQGNNFITALQFGSQIYSCASSHKNLSSKSSSGQGMRKLEKFRRGT